MTQAPLLHAVLAALSEYVPVDPGDTEMRTRFLEALTRPDILSRETSFGHITGSGLIVDKTSSRILLHYHPKIRKWIPFGGHAEPSDSAPWMIASRECSEETGIEHLQPYCQNGQPKLVDVDIHTIDARGREGQHLHFDLRYVLFSDGIDGPNRCRLANALLLSVAEAIGLSDQSNIHRFIQKTAAVIQDEANRGQQ